MNPKIVLCLALILVGNSHAAIVFPKLPEGCAQITPQELADLYKTQPFFFSRNLPAEKLKITTGAFRSYSLDYQSVLSGRMPDTVSSLSSDLDLWCYMLMSGTNMVGILTAGLDAQNHWKAQGGFGLMGQPNPIWVAYQKAEALPQVKKQDYEFRFVMMYPGFFGIWLHGKTDDIIIPFPQGYATSWKGYQPYSASEMIKLLRPVIENKLKARAVSKSTNAISGNLGYPGD